METVALSALFITTIIILLLIFLIFIFYDIIFLYLIPKIFGSVIGFIVFIGTKIYDFFNFIYQDGIIPAYQWIIDLGKKIWDKFVEVFNEVIVNNIKRLWSIIVSIFSKSKEYAEAGLSLGKEVAINIYNLGEDLVITGKNVFVAIWNFISNSVSSIVDSIISGINTIVNFFTTIANDVNSIIDAIIGIF